MMLRYLVAVAVFLNSIAPSYAYDAADGLYYFRYKPGIENPSVPPVEEDWASKTVTASFVGGVGLDFHERLPLKPEWEDDNWRVETGSLPDGIVFNSQTQAFEGTPTEVVGDAKATLYGYDTNGNRVARANVTFDIVNLPENSLKVDLYAHTGKFFNSTLDLPADVVVERWEEVKSAPSGIDYNGRYVDGTPTKAGQFPVLTIGYNFNGDAVFAYYGSFLVADGPEFPVISDDLKEISWFYQSAIWEEKNVTKIKRAVKDASKVRYYVEVAQGGEWPGTLRSNADDFKRFIAGSVFDYFDQATIRYKALDTDGAVGYSNWFKIGSLGPAGICTPTNGLQTIALQGTVGDAFLRTGYRIPTGRDAASKVFQVVSGQLPQGLTLDQDTGLISGTPLTEEIQTGIMIDVAFPGNGDAETVHCGPFTVQIAPASIDLVAEGGKKQYRVGEAMDVVLKPTGGLIEPYTVTLNDGATLPETVSFDPATGKLTGPLPVAGSYSSVFTLTNGDGITDTRAVTFSVHNDLAIDAVPVSSQIAQYDQKEEIFRIAYNKANIIGAESLSVQGGPLPQGIYLYEGELVVAGGTRLPPMSYGPFKIRLSDESGDFVETNDFHIEVTPREPLAGSVSEPQFQVNLAGSKKPFTVTQAPLAENFFPLNYELVGPALPEGLSFNEVSGVISGTTLRKETVPGFTVKVKEASPDNLEVTSAPFSVVVNDPLPIGVVTSPAVLKGNANGPFITSGALKNRLRDVVTRLVGGLDAVTFSSVDPAMGLVINSANGTLEGNPTTEFEGIVSIEFTDGGSRPGTLKFPVVIYPYPELTSEQKYELPRLAQASQYNVKVTANTGFYDGIDWSLAPGSDPLPGGLSLSSSGAIIGSTSASIGTVRHLIVRATSKANGIVVDRPFTLEVVERVPATLKFPETPFLTWINEQTGKVMERQSVVSRDYLNGSYVTPVVYSFAPNTAPEWMTINPSTGAISGNPTRTGDWTVTVVATDAENVPVQGDALVRVTLDGYPTMTPGGQELRIRQGQTFETEEQTLNNVVRPVEYVPSGSMPSTFSVNNATGVVRGRIDIATSTTWHMNIKDAHARAFRDSSQFRVVTLSPLSLKAPTENKAAKQFSAADPVYVAFDEPLSQIGRISYLIEGDIPGTLYYKYSDSQTGRAYYLRYDDGVYMGRIDQAADESIEATEYRLEPDHLIFDTATRTLQGVPSKVGTFHLKLVAYDHNGDTYVEPSDENRVSYNTAEQGFTLTVAPADALTISNSTASEQLYHYTSQPTLRTTVQNAAYGRPLTWQMVSGSLPQSVSAVRGASALSYSGYPESLGNYENIVWTARDAAGREVTSEAVRFAVGPRQTMELVTSTGNPRFMVVFDQDADMFVSAKNAAYGPNLGKTNWTLTGQENLPPGVDFTITDSGVRFHGTSDVIAVYDGIQVRGVDPLGAAATINLTFSVIANPEPIDLNVSNIKTKIGFPAVMEQPFAANPLSTSNTYGKLRFYSYDLPRNILLDQDTGDLAGIVNEPVIYNFDLWVTDDTNRVTSKPVQVEVMPKLRVLVPTQVIAEPYQPLKQAVATDYKLGTVTYAKGNGNWPAGVDVRPATGEIYATSSDGRLSTPLGEYPGLTIVATDTFTSATFGQFTDVQHSNVFSIKVETTGPYVSLQSSVLPEGVKRSAYTFDFKTLLELQNLQPDEIRWQLVSGPYPSGLSLNTTTGVLSGTFTNTNANTFTIRAYRSGNTSIQSIATYSIKINLPEIDLQLADANLGAFAGAEPLSVDLKGHLTTKNIPQADVRWTGPQAAVVEPDEKAGLPSGVTLNATTGLLSGTPTQSGTFRFGVTGSWSNLQPVTERAEDTGVYTLTVNGQKFDFAQISAGKRGHSCGTTLQGGAMCWGVGSYYTLGVPGLTSSLIPRHVTGLTSGVAAVYAGETISCALTTAGGVKCWGLAEYAGVGGNASYIMTATDVVGLTSGVSSISVGNDHACAVMDTGNVKCWGEGLSGKLGNGRASNSRVPVDVAGLEIEAASVSAGNTHTCAVLVNGSVKCWGAGGFGSSSNVPVQIIGWESGIKSVSAGTAHTCAVTTDGGVQCFGQNGSYQLGDNTDKSSATPVVVTGLSTRVVSVSAGDVHTCVVTESGGAKCWGHPGRGALGDGQTNATVRQPKDVVGLASGVTSISAGYYHSCAATASGPAKCWGLGTNGQNGNGSALDVLTPEDVGF